uniref:uncharacterized protein LOC122599465 n=1 Tax=Erigeron canadensis TaxID=72917 RepID=UPI001CB8F030|nr:uncharacterized protein LOC122599465 [Erigeron canadensis]
MEFKTGSIVEVFVSQSWRCARVLSRNGLDCKVSYDVYPGFTDQADVESISVEYLRPCPPFLEVSKSWIVGDAVEVFHNLSWNLATVLKDCGCDQFSVRLVGSLEELDVSGSEIRRSQKYEDGKWVEVDVTIPRIFKAAGCTKMLLKDEQDSGLEAKQGNTKALKRALSFCDSEDGGRPQKFRWVEKEGKRLRLLETSAEKEINDTHSVVSSSGSCSSNGYNPDEVCSGSGPVEDYESDVEFFSQLEDRIHDLELKRYCSEMEALYESGTLTWEEDGRITSLRQKYKVSENEHFSILKCLIYSSDNSIDR